MLKICPMTSRAKPELLPQVCCDPLLKVLHGTRDTRQMFLHSWVLREWQQHIFTSVWELRWKEVCRGLSHFPVPKGQLRPQPRMGFSPAGDFSQAVSDWGLTWGQVRLPRGTGCPHTWKTLQNVAGSRNRKQVQLRLCGPLPSENLEAKYETASNKEKENKTNDNHTGGNKHCVSHK